MPVRVLLTAAALLLGAAGPAAAAEVSVRVGPAGGVRLGSPTQVTGRATEGGAALAGRTVRLEVRRYPFKRPWRQRATRTTDASGRYAFAPKLDRNHRVRVRLIGVTPDEPYALPRPGALSRVHNAFVLPAFTLGYSQRRPGVIRIRQAYTVPSDVTLTAPTLFYVGPCVLNAAGECKPALAPLRARAATVRVRAGRFVARARVRIPKSYNGRFQYASCFAYSKGSGMGDPDLRCPQESIRLPS